MNQFKMLFRDMMGLSYTEELVSEYFKHLMEGDRARYVVSEKVKYRGPKGIGWSDIDVLAIGDKEVYIVETKQYAFRASKKESIKQISDSLDAAESFVRKQYYAKDKRIKKFFVATETARPLEEELRRRGIESYRLDEIVKELLKILRKRIYPKWPKRIRSGRGKEESNVTRTLLMLLEAGLIKEEI